MSPGGRTALSWLGTAITWISAPVGGTALAVFTVGSVLDLGHVLNGTAVVPTVDGALRFLSFGVIGIIWFATVLFVFFLHKTPRSRMIHASGGLLCTLASLPFAALFMP